MKNLITTPLFLLLFSTLPVFSQLNSLNLRLGKSIEYLEKGVGMGLNIGISSTLKFSKNDKSPIFEAEILYTQFAFPVDKGEIFYMVSVINHNFAKVIAIKEKHELLIGAQVSQTLKAEFTNLKGEKEHYFYPMTQFHPMFGYRYILNEDFKIDIRSLIALYDADFNNNHLTLQFSVQYKIK